ncbi:hypothetical protein [Nonomuraea rubra]
MLSLTSVDTEEEAMPLANATRLGGQYVFDAGFEHIIPSR